MGFIYMASPYSGTEGEQQERYEKVRWATAEFLKQGAVVYSPIVHCHNLVNSHGLPGTADFWRWYNRAMLSAAHTLWYLTLPGWKESVGLRWELKEARHFGMQINRVDIADGKLNVGPATFD